MIGSLRQRHILPMPTSAAILRDVGRIHLDSSSASFCRFAEQLVKKSRPGRIVNTFRETVVMRHAVDMQVLNADDAKPVNNPPTLLMTEIRTLEGDTLMDTGDGFAVFALLLGAFRQFGMFSLDFGKGLLFLAKEAGIGNLFTCRERGKGLESDINAHLLVVFRQALRFALTREANVPFASGGPMDGTRLDLARDGAMMNHLHGANLGEADPIIVGDAKARLREGERVIAVAATEAGKARFLTALAASEKGFERQINANGNILQHLRMDLFKRGAFLFQQGIRTLLSIARQTDTLLLVGVFPLLKQAVVEPTAFIKCTVQLVKLFLGRIDAILKHFQHIHSMHLSRTIVNGKGTLPQIPIK